MKVYFIFEIKNEPIGGSFQFTRSLYNYLESKGYITNSPSNADLFYASSHQFFKNIISIKKKYPAVPLVHRIDGPMSLYSGINDFRDILVKFLNKRVADATVFQSDWSREKSYMFGINTNEMQTTIMNASDPNFFYLKNLADLSANKKIRLISSSWSNNINKGFETYKWLDENLDFTKYEMYFIGNSPIKFTNIIKLAPLKSKNLAEELRKSDIYITASKNDPCSNSLIEAITCGLPVLALNSGGHPEIVGAYGELFDFNDQIPSLLEKIEKNYQSYVYKEGYNIKNTGDSYIEFFNRIISKKVNDELKVKKLSIFDIFYSITLFKMLHFSEVFRRRIIRR